MKNYNNLDAYFTELFNYDKDIDKKNDLFAKETMSEFDYSVRYHTNKNFNKIIFDTINNR